MKKAFSVILAITLCLGMMQIMPVTADAAGDTTPPKLISATLDKASCSVGEKLVLTLKFEEKESGIDPHVCSFEIWSTTHKTQKSLVDLRFTSNPDEETLIAEFDLDANSLQSDTFSIDNIMLKDISGNTKYYDNDNYDLPQFQFTNNIRTDWEAPVIKSIRADRSSANVGDTITFEVVAEDPSGITEGYVDLRRAQNQLIYPSIKLLPVEGKPGVLSGEFTVSARMPDCTCTIFAVSAYDTFGNHLPYVKGYPPNAVVLGFDTAIKINNPAANPSPDALPVLKSFSITPQSVKQGDTVKIRAEIDPVGQNIMDCEVSIKSEMWGNRPQECLYLYQKEDGFYEGEFIPQSNWPVGEYSIHWFCVRTEEQYFSRKLEWPNAKYDIYGEPIDPKFNVQPVYTGTENLTLPIGSSFDPMEGVRASNTKNGDMTDQIIVSGNVDTSKAGIYLIKYKIPCDPYSGRYYYDFRWIGMTDIIPEGQGAPLALSSSNLTVGAGSDEVSIKKDGVAIPYASTLNQKGNYEFQAKQPAAAAGSFGATASITYKSDKTNAMIDGTGPDITAVWQGAPPTGITVKASAKDPAHVEMMKWAAGSWTSAYFATGGTDFTDSFNIPSYGPYTIYARDGFGNESVKTYQITDGLLCGISASVGIFSEEFRSDVYKYTLYLNKDTPSVVITPQKTNPKNTMTTNGSRRASTTVKLNPGQSKKVTITVKQSSRKKVSYIVTVQRAADTNNSIASLSIKGGTVTPGTFDPSISNYMVILPAKKSTVSVRVKAASKYARVYIDGYKRTSRSISIKKGQTRGIQIKVCAQSGGQRIVYITIVRLTK